MLFHRSSLVCVLPKDIFYLHIKLDINGIASYCKAYKNISIYCTNSIYRPAIFSHDQPIIINKYSICFMNVFLQWL